MSLEKGKVQSSRLAASKVARVQAAVADSVLLAQPGEEALETEAVAAVRGGPVPNITLIIVLFKM